MTLRELQSKFSRMIGELIAWAYEHGYELTHGEAWRHKFMQAIHYVEKRSKTLDGPHLYRLAHDFNVFKDGVYLNKQDNAVELIRPLGEFWKSLDSRNRWGGDWGWDPGHFETKHN